MLFILTPQDSSSAYFDPEQVYRDYRRRAYVAALHEQQQEAQFERELALEEQRHRLALASISQQEAARRRRQASLHCAARRAATAAATTPGHCGAGGCGAGPAPEEILRRRRARQEEEERLSREFHKRILTQIFGDASDEAAPSTPAAQKPTTEPVASTSAKGKESTVERPRNEEPEPHWSAAPERAQSLVEIASINRAFASLKNTFVFPSGTLERLPDSDVPRLAYNQTNASIHAYEHALSELLTKLDGIESHGFKGVREARKQLVVKIEKALEELEKQVAERLAEGSSPVAAPVAIPASPAVAAENAPVAIPASTVIEASPVVAHTEEEVSDVVMHDKVEDSTTTQGYDVEIEVPEVTMQEASESTVASEPSEPPIATESTEVTARPTEELDTPIPIVADPVVEPSTEAESRTAPATSVSDEELEIEDAVRIEISSDEEEVVDVQHASEDADSETEGAFEML